MNKSETALRMRDAGRSWTDIAEATGLPVRDAKALVVEAKTQRRAALARTQTNETARGLRDRCHCGHYRKDHDGDDHDGTCRICGPERTVWVHYATGREYDQPDRPAAPEGTDPEDWIVWAADRGCATFQDPPARRSPWWHRWTAPWPDRGGRFRDTEDRPDLPGPSPRTARRRARRKG